MQINIKILILSVLSASIFWLLNALNKRYTVRLPLPIRLEYSSEDLVVVKPPPEELKLSLTGIGWDLLRQRNWIQSRPPLLVNLSEPTSTKSLSRQMLLSTFSDQLYPLRLNHVAENDINIDLQARTSKRVTLFLDSLDIPLCENCRIYSPITLNTDTFTLSGAANYVKDFPPTYPLRLNSNEKIDETFEKAIIDLSLPHKEVLQAHPSEVEVHFSVGRYEDKEITIRIERLNFPRKGRFKALLSDTLLGISYTVRIDQATAVKPELFTVIADYKKHDPKSRILIPEIIYAPPEALNIHLHPPNLSIRYVYRKPAQ